MRKTPSTKQSQKGSDRALPVGICETRFYNPEHRTNKDPKTARPCFYAYVGGKGRYKAKRFMIDTLGREKALREAKRWRREQQQALLAAGDAAATPEQTATSTAQAATKTAQPRKAAARRTA